MCDFIKPYSLLLCVFFSIFLFLVGSGCGGDSDFSVVGGVVRETGLTPGEVLYGRLTVIPVLAVLDDKQREILATLQGDWVGPELKVSRNGEMVVWPGSPGSQWRIKIGDQTVLADNTGYF